MQQIIEKIINRINEDPVKLNGIFAGSGSSFANWFLTTPGSSNTVIQFDFPYAQSSLHTLLGKVPDGYVTEQVANELANIAYERALDLVSSEGKIIGVGCTSALISNVGKKGEHRAYVSIRSEKEMYSAVLKLHKGCRDRAQEENLVSKFILANVSEYCFNGNETNLLEDLCPEDEILKKANEYYGVIEKFYKTNEAFLIIDKEGCIVKTSYRPEAVISGSFNPLHSGHRQLVKVIEEMNDSKVDFEISIYNVDKDIMTIEDINQRIVQFIGVGTIIISKAKTFVEKSVNFKGCSFVVGWDTAVRVLDPKYYDDSYQSMLSALTDIKKNECSFIVAGRKEKFGRFRNAEEINIPEDYADMFCMIEEKTFRNDISSTDIRIQN